VIKVTKKTTDEIDEQVNASVVATPKRLMEELVDDLAEKYKAIGGKTGEDVPALAEMV